MSCVGNICNLNFFSPNQTFRVDLFLNSSSNLVQEFNILSIINLNIKDDNGLCNDSLLCFWLSSSFSLLSFFLGFLFSFWVITKEIINIIFSLLDWFWCFSGWFGFLSWSWFSSLCPLISNLWCECREEGIPEINFYVLIFSRGFFDWFLKIRYLL